MTVTRVATRAAQVAAAQRRRGATVGVVGTVTSKAAALAAIGRALRFPDYYGQNLDGLEDCVRDLSWLPAGAIVLVWGGDGVLRRADPPSHASILEILTDAAADSGAGERPLRLILTAP
ncbi:barstar family protein [Pseudonocardia sp. GCM10023141]|uniref:barstar family protein n=1 Tax=Pseudonocardia sp. GCM10023141 TaxID=3252653 RepID=UPI00361E196A